MTRIVSEGVGTLAIVEANQASAQQACPASALSARKAVPDEPEAGPRVARIGGVWHVRSAELARQVLRERDGTHQAGFMSEETQAGRSTMKPPILFMDGGEHRTQRAQTARYFAPRTVDKRYRQLMIERADGLVADAVSAGTFDLDQYSLRYSVEIASQVIGLTESGIPGMSRRLERLFSQVPKKPGAEATLPSRFVAISNAIKPLSATGNFYLRDVRPAIRSRRKHPQEDVITHLLSEDYSDSEILTECVTYGAAGMITTREYISMCVWHFLHDAELRERYLAAEEAGRYAILNEILRLEPIVGHLYRRVMQDFVLTDGEETHEFRVGELVDLYIRETNVDASVVGEAPEQLRPLRDLPRGISGEVLSFGDGAHKCPGNALAIQESDTLLTRLLALNLEIVAEPGLKWDDLIAAYSLTKFTLRVRPADRPARPADSAAAVA